MVSGLGFDLKFLGSLKHVSDKLQSLSPEQLEALKESFIKNDHPRFRREFAANRHMPYGTSAAEINQIIEIDGEEESVLYLSVVGHPI